ncbi:hypothetical protein BJF78_11410 [Pseudonocardia sp. CNS-139]|nr:hypothetical protein BJF78_11410 [Pseudonocardia sp. CNS-139]
MADPYPWPTLFCGLVAAGTLLGLVAVFATVPAVVVGVVVLLGAVAFIAGAPLNARVFALAGAAPTLASATNTSAFNVGNSLGPALGGLAIAGGLGLTAPAWLGVALSAGAVAVAFVSWRLDRAETA